jgi:phosphoribosylanthranilate isomerase
MMETMRQNEVVNIDSAAHTHIKFCGMTRMDDVRIAQRLGVDAIGMIFAPKSPRCINLSHALRLREGLSVELPMPRIVALVVDADAALLADLASTLKPDLIQFHGSESAQDCELSEVAYLRAVPMHGMTNLATWLSAYPHAAGFVFDSHAPGGSGGSGQVFDWNQLPQDRRNVWLAGGLNPDNVGEAVRRVRPYAVDVSSGIESAPGIKCAEKMQRFVEEVRRADVATRSQ